MSGSKGLQRYNGVEQDDEGAYVYYDEHIAALRRAKAEGMREARARIEHAFEHGDIVQDVLDDLDARAAQIEADHE